MSTNQTATALAEHDAGRLDRAESIYRTRLAEAPDDVAALIGLGDVLTDARQLTEAEGFYRRAIELDGESTTAAGAYDGLAAIRQDIGDLDTAVTASKKAAILRGNADDTFGVGNTLEYLGRIPDAIEMFLLATQQRPGFTQAHLKAAQQLLATGRAEESIPHYLKVIEERPDVAELHCNLANARRKTGDLTEALKSCRRAIELNPRLADAHNVMGTIWTDRRRPSDALESFKRALDIKPDLASAMNNMAGILERAGQVKAAGSLFARAVELHPEVVEFHENLGANLLLQGDFERGWLELDWRRLKRTNPGSRAFPQPAWDGSPLDGKTIVLFAEQRFSDTIQFLRYVKLVADKGGRIVLECQPALVSLARQMPGVAEVIAQGDPWPACDCQTALMSLPLHFNTQLPTIPAQVPYITADDQKSATWKNRLQGLPGRRVGLAWATGKTGQTDKRQLSPATLSRLADVKNISFVSLQKGDDVAVPPNLPLADFTADLTDFSETAALIANLDLVITVDTAVAHLAGATGKPVWIMLPAVSDWRWLLDRSDSPWYPTARLFRQSESQGWSEVIDAVAKALQEF
jgi:tetratricopeptide (TPR) repeat protein